MREIHEPTFEDHRLKPTNDACVANTIVSICSRISGQEFKVPDIYYERREMMIKDMIRMYATHQRRGLGTHSKEFHENSMHRLDQKSFMKFIDEAKQGRGVPLEAALLQTVLQDVEVDYKRGRIEEIKREIGMGRQVAANFQVGDEQNPGKKIWHIAHIGMNKEGKLISCSDGNKPLSGDDVVQINLASDYLNHSVHTWNFVSVRKIGD